VSDFLFSFHSGWRYMVLLTGAVALALPLIGLRSPTLGNGALRALRVFTVTLDVQFLLGTVLVFVRPFFPAVIGHIVMMVSAVALAHLLAVAIRKRPPERRTPALAATGVGICLVLIVGGILSIGRALV
jgi:hypothetical protein